jgi:hypothetical protein
MPVTPKAAQIVIAVTGLVLLVGVAQGVLKHSLAQVLFMFAGLTGCVGFWHNPHYLKMSKSTLQRSVGQSYDKVGHIFFRASTLLLLAGACALAVRH